MPRPRIGAEPMSPAERQARHRAKLPALPAPARPGERVPDRRRVRPLPRPDRWAAAVATLVVLQEEYRAWFDNPGLRRGRLCRPTWKNPGSPTSCRQSPSSISRSCRQSIRRAATAATDRGGPIPRHRPNRTTEPDPHNSSPHLATGKDRDSKMAIGRSEDRDNPWNPLVLRHHNPVWDPSRVTHLGQRSFDRTSKAGTYDRNRPDPFELPRPCETGAVHIWVPAFAGVTGFW